MSGKWGLDVLGVVMAGGDGERLWPVSTRERPKQFQDLLGLGETSKRGVAIKRGLRGVARSGRDKRKAC